MRVYPYVTKHDRSEIRLRLDGVLECYEAGRRVSVDELGSQAQVFADTLQWLLKRALLGPLEPCKWR